MVAEFDLDNLYANCKKNLSKDQKVKLEEEKKNAKKQNWKNNQSYKVENFAVEKLKRFPKNGLFQL